MGNHDPYSDKLVPSPTRDLDPSHSLRTGVEPGTRSTSSGRALNVEPPWGQPRLVSAGAGTFLTESLRVEGLSSCNVSSFG